MFQPGKNILVVADHPRLRATIRKLLQRLGLSAVECSDGAAAREQLATLVPELVILDLVLPASSGFELCEFIRQSPVHARVPLLAMSNRSSPESRANAFEAGADAFLGKPFTEDELRCAIEDLLEERAPRLSASGQ
jgi:DNA-binding response OmpR family regulator